MLTNQFLQYINKEKLFNPLDKLLVAVSGGLDSVVLSHLLKAINQPFAIAHMNFQLRGVDSGLDEEFVLQLSKSLNVDCHIKKVNIEQSAVSESIQMQARKLRYDWFEELLHLQGYRHVLTAHHLNDSFETSILNLVRGTGIKGLRGIKPKRKEIIRPLLFATKSELLAFANEHKLSWREDYSNASDKYKRNYIRHQITPLLEKQNPSLLKHFQLTSKRLMAAETAFLSVIAGYKNTHLEKEGDFIKIKKSILVENSGEVYLHELIKEYGFSFAQIAQFDFDKVGARLDSSTHKLLIDRANIIIDSIKHEWQEIGVITIEKAEGFFRNDLFQMKIESIEGNLIDKDLPVNMASVDEKLLKGKLTLRLWQSGDKFQPLGMKGQKKVSDYLIDKKVPLSLKERQLVLLNEEEIIWLVGHQINDKYKVTKRTAQQLRLSFKHHIK